MKNPGLFTTVQDRGRVGFRDIGVPTSGVLDVDAMRLANALVGNDAAAAVLECLGLGPELEAVDGPVRLALIGDAPHARVVRGDGTTNAVPAAQSVTLAPGDRIAVGALRETFSLCFAIRGGVDAAPVLGSRSTYVRGGFGGQSGRPLQAGDVLLLGASPHGSDRESRLSDDWRLPSRAPVRVVLGPQDDAFTPEGLAAFLQGPYAVSTNADRMGFRLEGPHIAHRTGPDIVSDGAVFGSIQVPGSGQPIILLADGQSVGGYTKIATVISADHAALVRRKPGALVRFAAVSQEEGERLARDHERWMQSLIDGIEPFQEGLDLQALYERNLVSGVVDAT